MLTELYQYAIRHELVARPGFKPKRPKAYVQLTLNGEFIGLSLCEKNAPPAMAPDIGAAAQGTKACNPLIEKAGICLRIVADEIRDQNIAVKHQFFREFFNQGKMAEPLFAAVETALSAEAVLETIRRDLAAQNLKASDPVGFAVDGLRLDQSNRYWDWWDTYRRQYIKSSDNDEARCLITGTLTQAMPTIPKVSGLISVGGHSSGDAFLCFDKDAFQSYDLDKKIGRASCRERVLM